MLKYLSPVCMFTGCPCRNTADVTNTSKQLPSSQIISLLSSTSKSATSTSSNTGNVMYKSRFTNSAKNKTSSMTGGTGSIFPTLTVEDGFSNASGPAIPRKHRVLAYGASMTAGTSGRNLFPFSVYLEQALHERQQQQQRNADGSDEYSRNIVVRHRGIPGMKVQEMVDNLDGEQRGLRKAIQSISNPSLSIVIILAGTNDIGYELAYNNNNVEIAAQTIFTNIITLHEICYENNVPYTIAIGIPSSGYQHQIIDAANVASKVNEKLQQYASTSYLSSENHDNGSTFATSTTIPLDDEGRSRMIYMEFPFEYVPDGENWHSDTLHFSQKGYEILGESLAPIVEQIVCEYLLKEL